jgi:hypothetical protein
LGTFSGWVVAIFSLFSYQIWAEAGETHDSTFWLAWTSMVVAAWWILLVVPVLSGGRVSRILSQPATACLYGMLLGTFGYVLLVGWWAGFRWLTIAFAGVVGLVTGIVVFLALRTKHARSAAPQRPRTLATYYLTPPIAIVLWTVALWPGICRVAPNMAYTYGDSGTQQWIIRHALQQVSVGDPVERLRGMLPTEFAKVGKSGAIAGTMYAERVEYRLVWVNGVITQKQIQDLSKEAQN